MLNHRLAAVFMIRVKSMVVWLAMATLLVGCSGDPTSLEEAVEASDAGLVSLAIVPPARFGTSAITVNAGQQIQYRFSGTGLQGQPLALSTTDRRWSVSDNSVARISSGGLLTALNDGVVSVNLRVGGVAAAPSTLSVSTSQLQSIDQIDGPSQLVECSRSTPYSASGTFADGSVRALDSVTWRVDSTGQGRILEESSLTATLAALSPGIISLSATSDDVTGSIDIDVVAGLTGLSIEPENADVERSATRPLLARATYTDNSSADVTGVVTWGTTDNGSIATVSNALDSAGELTGVAVGTTSVTARCSDAEAASAIRVLVPTNITSLEVLPDDSPIVISLAGGEEQIRVFAISSLGSREERTNDATWRVESGTDVISVDGSGSERGAVTPLTTGVATLEISFGGAETTVSIRVE